MNVKNEKNPTIEEIQRSVYEEITNKEKNNYDAEVQMPSDIEEMKPEKREYRVNPEKDTTQNQKRRKSRPTTIETNIANGNTEKARERIKRQYYISIAKMIEDEKFDCVEKTARKLIESLNKMIGYDGQTQIPIALEDEYAECINQWKARSTIAYECSSEPNIAIKIMEKADMINTYKYYQIIKKIILFDCKNKEEYDQRVSAMLKNEQIKEAYEVGKILAPYLT